MSIRTFWLIFLKVIGIFLLYGAMSIIPSLATIPMMFNFGVGVEETIVPLAITLISAVVYGLLVYLFIFRAGYVLRLLRLEDGFEEEDGIELDVQPVTLLTFAAIIVGGIMVVNGLPSLVKELHTNLSMSKFYGAENGYGWALYYLAQIVLGFLLIFKSKPIVQFIEQRANDSMGAGQDNEPLDADDGS